MRQNGSMAQPLDVAVAQPPCAPLDVSANVAAHAAAVRAAGARVVVFPELSLTGYELAAPVVAPDDPRLEPLVAACAATGRLALAGAIVEGPHGGRSIGMLAVDGAATTVAYRKLWPGAAEVAAGIEAGAEPVVFTVDGWRLGLAICRDTGVVQHAADTAALGIDVYVAGIVHAADEGTEHVARAARVGRDHGVWVAIASAAGHTGTAYPATAGRSGIWAPDGTAAATCGENPGAVATATLT